MRAAFAAFAFVAAAAVSVTLDACTRGPVVATHVVDDNGSRPLTGAPPAPHKVVDVDLASRVRIVGADVPAHAKPGDSVPITVQFLVERDCSTTSPQVFIHAAAPGAEVNQGGADHAMLRGKVSSTEWRPGDLLIDTFPLAIPANLGVDELVVYAGLYEGKDRWATSPKQKDDRTEMGRIHVDGAPPVDVSAIVHKRSSGGPIVVDGKLDEAAWAAAQELGPFVAWDGKQKITRPTTAKLVWDEQNLYVAFIGKDPDVFTPYVNDDDPLYDSEAVEIFIDADGDKDVYVELQDAPAKDLHFDAAFAGGRRKNMDRAYHAAYETKSLVDADGFVSEWRIPIADVKDVPPGEPKVGAVWRVNLFRLERVRSGGPGAWGRVTSNEASAWSSPLSGDFHNLDRFAAITFVE